MQKFTQCKICNKNFTRLSRHITSTHKINFYDYLIQYEYNGEPPTCLCGCGKTPPYISNFGMGFKDYIKGHHLIGKPRSEEIKKKIGIKNSINMLNYIEQHPEFREIKKEQLSSGLTDEIRKQAIENCIKTYENMTTEEKQKFSIHTKRLWEEGILNKEIAKKAGQTFHERFINGEYDFTEGRKKLSNAITQLYLNGGFQWARGHYTSIKSNKTYHYRSSWELKYMEMLDNDIDVLNWEYEPFSIKYIFEEKEKNYIPDFIIEYINGVKKLIEIKPKNLVDYGKNKAKAEFGQKWAKENGFVYEVVSF